MRNPILWLVWLVLTLGGGAALAAAVFFGGDRTPLLPGDTTGVHHQIEAACETCHAADPLETSAKALKSMNKACLACHKDELNVSNDSHPYKKFRDPRMSDFWEKLDARLCTSCHIEHKPEITRTGAVTLPMDYCVACHSEGKLDVRVNRPSHEGLGFETCASAGCHNFHDNTALYEDFLVKHQGGNWLKDTPIISFAAEMRAEDAVLAKTIGDYLKPAQANAPDDILAAFDPEELAEWAASGHAEAGVNCAYCHAPKGAKKNDPEKIAANWANEVPPKTCAKCHREEQVSWTEGRHGMTAHKKIAKPRKLEKQFKKWGLKGYEDTLPSSVRDLLTEARPAPQMSVAHAQIPMKPDAHDRDLSCASCHDAHAVNTQPARVEACVSCHDDTHTVAYFDSQHYKLFLAETSGEGAPGSGVGCSDCHMPKIAHPDTGKRFTTHNQNAYLRPNEKMIRPVCMECHNLEFAIDALADPALVANNFQGRPATHIESIDWAARRVETEDSRQ